VVTVKKAPPWAPTICMCDKAQTKMRKKKGNMGKTNGKETLGRATNQRQKHENNMSNDITH